MSKSPFIVIVAAFAAAAGAGCGSTGKSTTAKSAVASHARVTSSIVEGAKLAKPVVWEARVAGVTLRDVAEVRFLIDGKVRHIERKARYVFAGDGNRLLPGTLGSGSHTFAVDVRLAKGPRLTTAATATVPPEAQGVPGEVTGRWQRNITAAEVGRTESTRRPEDGDPLPTGRWTLQIGADAVARYVDPSRGPDSLTVGQVRFGPGGRLVVGNEIPNVPGAQGYFCPETRPPGQYRWSVTGGALVIRVVNDRGCADRNSFWTGRFTR
jgi:hypothetical protein